MNKSFINFYLILITYFIVIDLYGQNSVYSTDILSKWESTTAEQPGVSVGVLQAGVIKYKRTIGFANLEYKIPLDDNSIFDIASLAKQFTGFAIAKLIVEKKLKLNDKASCYLPELGILDQGILLKHLVYHTSGLRDVGELFALSNQGEIFTSKEALDLVGGQKDLNFEPGSEYDYSNTNYVLLAIIVERITGESFREWSDINLFAPLNMNHSFVNDNPYAIIRNRVVAYYSDKSSFSFQQNNGMSLIGSSAVYSNLNDMILWAQALQEELLFPEVFKLMKTKGKLDNGQEVNYGFGLAIDKFEGYTIIEHSGATPSGFRTQIVTIPEEDLAFVILSNWGDIEPIGDIGRVILEEYLSIKKEKENIMEPKPHIYVTKEMVERYIGKYLFNGELDVVIRADSENQLTLQLDGQGFAPLFALSDTTFDLPALRSTLVFHKGGKGLHKSATVMMGEKQEGILQRKIPEEKMKIDFSSYEGVFHSSELNIVFELEVINDRLYISNTKMGKVLMNDKSKEVFVPVEGVASSLVFSFSDTNEVDGFLLNRGSRVRNLKFFKIMI